MVNFTVYGEPRGKGRPRAAKRGSFIKVFTDDKTAAYENLIKLSYINAHQENYFNDEPLAVIIRAFFSIPQTVSNKRRAAMLEGKIRPQKKPDLDNIIKELDGLNGVCFADDKQIIEITAGKYYSSTPRLEISIYPVCLGEEPAAPEPAAAERNLLNL